MQNTVIEEKLKILDGMLERQPEVKELFRNFDSKEEVMIIDMLSINKDDEIEFKCGTMPKSDLLGCITKPKRTKQDELLIVIKTLEKVDTRIIFLIGYGLVTYPIKDVYVNTADITARIADMVADIID